MAADHASLGLTALGSTTCVYDWLRSHRREHPLCRQQPEGDRWRWTGRMRHLRRVACSTPAHQGHHSSHTSHPYSLSPIFRRRFYHHHPRSHHVPHRPKKDTSRRPGRRGRSTGFSTRTCVTSCSCIFTPKESHVAFGRAFGGVWQRQACCHR